MPEIEKQYTNGEITVWDPPKTYAWKAYTWKAHAGYATYLPQRDGMQGG